MAAFEAGLWSSLRSFWGDGILACLVFHFLEGYLWLCLRCALWLLLRPFCFMQDGPKWARVSQRLARKTCAKTPRKSVAWHCKTLASAKQVRYPSESGGLHVGSSLVFMVKGINVNRRVFLVFFFFPSYCCHLVVVQWALCVFSAVLHIYKLQEVILGFRQPPSQPSGWGQQLLTSGF